MIYNEQVSNGIYWTHCLYYEYGVLFKHEGMDIKKLPFVKVWQIVLNFTFGNIIQVLWIYQFSAAPKQMFQQSLPIRRKWAFKGIKS